MVIPKERDDRYTPWTDYCARFLNIDIVPVVNEVFSDNLVIGHQVQVEAVTLLTDGVGFYVFEVFIQHNMAELHAGASGPIAANNYFINNLGLLLTESIHIAGRIVGGGPITYFRMDIAGKQRSLRK